jgi:hypothetical protein
MTTIIISDIHNKVRWIEPALEKLKEKYAYDEVVFLGDYFDNFGDSTFEAGGTANWLKCSIQNSNRIHLLGNHDMPYMIPHNDSLWCPGFNQYKCRVINETLKDMWHLFRPAYFTQNYLLSHAGFHPMLVTHPVKGVPSPDELIVMANKGLEHLKTGLPHPLFNPGSRMGEPYIGGITWADWNDEFVCLDNVNQIVGHTPHNKVRMKNNDTCLNYCMDTHTQHIGIIIDGVVNFELRTQLLGF